MEKRYLTVTTVFMLLLMFAACKKETVLTGSKNVINVQVKGYVMADTLEFVINGKILGQAIESTFTSGDGGWSGSYINAGDEITVRKKADGKTVGTIKISESPFEQEKKIFYDGTTLTDNLVLTPVSNPDNFGFKLQFKTTFADFYGGPVDIEFFEESTTTTRPRIITYKSIKLIAGVTGSFGNFNELPPLLPETGKRKVYAFKIYKAGTKDLPYTKMDHVDIPDPDNTYGYLDEVSPAPGMSMLISISPVLIDENGNQGPNGAFVSAGFQLFDFASAFR
jgi:hypothetical protein